MDGGRVGMSMSQCLFLQDAEALAEVFDGYPQGYLAQNFLVGLIFLLLTNLVDVLAPKKNI